MYKKINACPVCGSEDIENIIICKDLLLTGESFAVNECHACSFRFTNPRPDSSLLGKYYESDDYISHTNRPNNFIQFLYKIVRIYTLRKKLKLINSLSGHGDILDVGCGTGEFLKICKENGWITSGVETNDPARKKTEKLLDQKINVDLFEIIQDSYFNIITLWHVLEHLPDIHKTMKHLKKLISNKGFILIAVPNYKSYDAEKYGEYWAGYDVPRHLSHFNQKAFKTFAKMHDLKIKNIIPLKLDAFYVSLLSETYLKKRNKYINSFITGLLSNSYAKKHDDNYSSLIYILKK